MCLIRHLFINLYIKNNDEELSYTKIPCKYKDNKYIFDIDSDKYEIDVKDNIVFHKKNSESNLDLIFENNKMTTGTYYIKELNFYMDAKVKTIKYKKEDNKIEVEYKLWLQDEEIGNFVFKLEVKE